MITTVAISGYRSLREVVLPLEQLTVVTGANGTGKSSVYRSLRLLADIADDRIIASLAREGGFESVRWAGPETLSRGMRDGSVPIQGTVRQGPVALKLGFTEDSLSYSIELGLPVPGDSLFNSDPEIKRECLWLGPKPGRTNVIADRRGPGVRVQDEDGEHHQYTTSMPPFDSIVRHVTGQKAPAELAQLRNRLSAWRFYDQMRTDAEAPARSPQIGTRTIALAPNGENLAAAVQTIYEIGDREALDTAIETAFNGARLSVEDSDGLFRLYMHQHGMLRPLSASELSDGTLKFIMLTAALLSPRPAPLIVLNEPESSLHSSIIPALASLIVRASQDMQVIVVSHNRTLVSSLLGAETGLVELHKETGETFVEAGDLPDWRWPAR